MIKVGLIIERYRDDPNYDTRIERPDHRLMKIVRIEILADCLCEKHSKSYPLLTPITHEERLQSITEQGYEVLNDPPSDGNYQFSAVAYTSRKLGIFKSAVTLKNEVTNYLNTND